jgi:hypothetical protein
LINSEKNEILGRRSFSTLLSKQVLETLLAAPRRRYKRHGREKMADKNQSGPKKANQRQDPQPMTTKPLHVRANIPSLGDLNMAFRRFIPRGGWIAATGHRRFGFSLRSGS